MLQLKGWISVRNRREHMQPLADGALENSVKDAEGAKNSQAKGQSASDSILNPFEFEIALFKPLRFEFFVYKNIYKEK